MPTIARDVFIGLLRTESDCNVSLQNQIAGKLRQLILNGQLTPGSRLPAGRTLASDMGVARITVEAAYGKLEAEGYLMRRVGAGTFICKDVHLPRITRYDEVSNASTMPLSRRGQLTLESTACRDHHDRVAFNAGTPDLHAFPHAIWQRLINQQCRLNAAHLGDYGDPQGFLPLRKAIASWLAQSRGVNCHAGQILILTSSQQAIQMAASLLLDIGDLAAIEDPGYLGARTALAAAGATLVPVQVDKLGAIPADLPDDVCPKMIYLTPSHQYPLGYALSLPRRLAWLEKARRHGSWIIEDDYDGEFQYDQRPLPALQSLDREGRVIYIGTFSKVLLPSLRLAYMVLPGTLAETFAQARTAFDGHSAQLMQAVAAEFIAQGHFASHIRQMRQLYRSRRDLLLDCLRPLDHWLKPIAFESGLQFSISIAPPLESPVSSMAEIRGLILRPLSRLHIGKVRHHGWMLGYSALDNQTIRNSSELLHQLLIEHIQA